MGAASDGGALRGVRCSLDVELVGADEPGAGSRSPVSRLRIEARDSRGATLIGAEVELFVDDLGIIRLRGGDSQSFAPPREDPPTRLPRRFDSILDVASDEEVDEAIDREHEETMRDRHDRPPRDERPRLSRALDREREAEREMRDHDPARDVVESPLDTNPGDQKRGPYGQT